jgi:hypothetical protein
MKKYIEYIKGLGLSDLEIIMKIVDDMHTNIGGYDEPKVDVPGFYRLDVGSADSTGVCRNMAEHIAYLLAKINPKSKARVINVYCGVEYVESPISRRLNNDYVRKMNQDYIFETSKKINHAAVIMSLPGERFKLVIDPTAGAIGVLANNEITLLNKSKGEYGFRPDNAFYNLAFGYVDGYNLIDLARNIDGCNGVQVDFERLRQEWGFDAQKSALDRVRSIPRAIERARAAYNSPIVTKRIRGDKFVSKDMVANPTTFEPDK